VGGIIPTPSPSPFLHFNFFLLEFRGSFVIRSTVRPIIVQCGNARRPVRTRSTGWLLNEAVDCDRCSRHDDSFVRILLVGRASR